MTTAVERARQVAESVTDPELPMLTLADLGILRDVKVDATGTVEVAITPTYSGCPAMATMRDDLIHSLKRAGFDAVRVRVELAPAWTTDWITPSGRKALHIAGMSAPGGPVTCPRCGSLDTALISEFGSTACRALYRCDECLEPFDHVKEI